MNKIKSHLVMLVVVVLLSSGVMIPAQAAMIQTQDIAVQKATELNKARISEFFGRDEVRDQMLNQGITPAETAARLNALSPAETTYLAQKIDSLPAGGANVLSVALLIFLVLLFTDVMGFTQIFPFVVNTAK